MDRFTVASFNARWGYDLTDTPFDLVAVCTDLAADVIALQEVWEAFGTEGEARRAADALGYHFAEARLSGSNVRSGPRITRAEEEIDGWWGIALLSRYPLRSVRAVALGRTVGRVDLAERHLLTAELEVGGATISVAVVHLSFFLPDAVAQLVRLRRRLDAAVRHPTVVVGDFNLPAAVVSRAFRGWQRGVRGRTWPAHRPVSQLDHVLVRGGLDAGSGAVLSRTGSDHRPIRTALSLPPVPEDLSWRGAEGSSRSGGGGGQ